MYDTTRAIRSTQYVIVRGTSTTGGTEIRRGLACVHAKREH
jgi:hypothetical protein